MIDQHAAFRAAVERRDLDGLVATFAPDAVLNSPVKFTPFEGLDEVRMILRILLEVFVSLSYYPVTGTIDPSEAYRDLDPWLLARGGF